MREARFDDLVNFSSLLWKWMLDDKNSEALQFAVDHAFELYHRDLNFARQPFGNPESFSEDEVFCMLSNFDKLSFQSLVTFLKSIPSTSEHDKKNLISRILNIADPARFEERYERWRQFEFSQKEFKILKGMLESASSEYSMLIKKLCQEEQSQDQDGMQPYIKYLESMAAQTGKVVAHAGGVVKSALATVYSAAMDRVVHNSAIDFQAQAQSPRDFILQGALNVDGSWDEETSVRYLARKWPSLNMRVIDTVCRAFYMSQVSDPAAGKVERIVKKNSGNAKVQARAATVSGHSEEGEPSNSNRSNANNATHNQDCDYVLFPEGDVINKAEDAESQQSMPVSQVSRLMALDPSLALFGNARISPLKKPRHALAIYMSLLTHDVELKRTKRMTSAAESSAALPPPQEEIRLTTVKTSVNFFNSAAAASSGSHSTGDEHSSAPRSGDGHSVKHQCEFCVVDMLPK